MENIDTSVINLAMETLLESQKSFIVTIQDQHSVICEMADELDLYSEMMDDFCYFEDEMTSEEIEIVRLRKKIRQLRIGLASAEYIAGLRDHPPTIKK